MSDSSLAALVVLAILVVLALWLWLWLRGRRAGTRSFSSDGISRASKRDPHCEKWDTLTRREQEVVSLAVQGLQTAEIARELTISVHTVDSHLKHAYAKLGVHSRAELSRAVRELVD